MMTDSAMQTSAQLSSLLDVTSSILYVLDRFNHRSRNQHHVAKWWSSFGILRRCLRRLVESLETFKTHTKTSARKAEYASRKAKAKAAERKVILQEEVSARILWLNDHVLASAYIAFSQLAADQQHAPSGLLLIGLLAQLSQALGPFLSSELEDEDGKGKRASISSNHASPSVTFDPEHEEAENPESADMGVVVSRSKMSIYDDEDEGSGSLLSSGSVKKNTSTQSSQSLTKTTSRSVTPQPASLVSSSKSTTAVSTPSLKRPAGAVDKSKANTKDSKPVKKRKKKGDEFSDMFASLF